MPPPQLPRASRRIGSRRSTQMRMRIEKERTPAGKDDLAIKTGRGGLMDAEFVAQALCLENGWQEANTLRALERGREAAVLPEADKLIETTASSGASRASCAAGVTKAKPCCRTIRRRIIAFRVRCGFPTPDAFREALAGYRKAIREVYARVFGT